MHLFFILFLCVEPSQQNILSDAIEKIKEAFQFNTDVPFKGIPEFPELASDERREIYHYEQTVAVRDIRLDGRLLRCEVMEVYKEQVAKDVCENLVKLFKIKVQKVTMKKIMRVMNECDLLGGYTTVIVEQPEIILQKLNEMDKRVSFPTEIFKGIVPGTKWCGFGDLAKKYDDLGELRNMDRCCRAHDLCPIKIKSKDKRYNLENKAIYTKSHCECDRVFRDCLKTIKGWTAELVEKLYFYVTEPECIKGLPEIPEDKIEFQSGIEKSQLRPLEFKTDVIFFRD